MLRFLTAGESHGKGLVSILEGMVADLPLSADDINYELARRQQGYGRGGRMQIEKDEVEIISGVRFGKTLGSPISFIIWNKDWDNWKEIMAVNGPTGQQAKPVTNLRPGHADLAGTIKYNQKDIRNILERASARETAARVAIGAIAKQFLKEFKIGIKSRVLEIGGLTNEEEIKAAIDRAQDIGDSLGGVFEVKAVNVPIGLGSHVHYDLRLSSKLAAAIMSIPAIKGFEIGMGFGCAKLPGSKVHDEIFYSDGKYSHKTNNAGGIEGGMTNGESVVVRAAMKPIATIKKPLKSVDLLTKKTVEAHVERADVCAVPAAAVIGEAMVAYEIASALLQKFGGDSLGETKSNYEVFYK